MSRGGIVQAVFVNKRAFFSLFFTFIICFCAYGQYSRGALHDEQRAFFTGVGFEMNGYSRDSGPSVGLGAHLAMDYRVNEWVGMGMSMGISKDMSSLSGDETNMFQVLELYVFLRLYFLRFREIREYFFEFSDIFHPFLQLNAGGMSADDYTPELQRTYGERVIEGMAGIRIHIAMIYIEPYIRMGYPISYGGGLSIGYRFD